MEFYGSITAPGSSRFSDLRLLLVGVLLLLIGIQFWAGSRYPSLEGKAVAGEASDIGMLSFEPALNEFQGNRTVSHERVRLDWPDLAVLKQSVLVTINWLDGNWRGMTFGILFAAAIMTLLTLLGPIQFKSGLANAIFGTVVGAPLGVCVNCAAPIALGMQSRGTRIETSLAAMIASPTLNVIILAMMVTLFPLWMVATKIIATVIFLLIGIPLIAAVMGRSGVPMEAEMSAADLGALAGRPVPLSARWADWRDASTWVGQSFGRHLWYVVVRAVPLMILAGFLGAFAISWLPWDTLATLLPESGVGAAVALVLVAAFGVFLPVPIAFDIIITAVLLSLGLPGKYAMVLLFTLGIYSIYSAFIVQQMGSWKLSAVMFVALVGMGAATGVVGEKLEIRQWAAQRALLDQAFAQPFDPAPFRVTKPTAGPTGPLLSSLEAGALRPTPTSLGSGGLAVAAFPSRATGAPNGRFMLHDGPGLGLDRPIGERVGRPMFPFTEHNGSIAAGDVHGDGWPDILVASDPDVGGVELFANVAGPGGSRRFVRQSIGIGEFDTLYVSVAALADLDGDGALDIFFSTWEHGNAVVYNRGGEFTADAVQMLPSLDDALASAVDFGDLDRDGDLDIVVANWTMGYANGTNFAARPSSRDIVLYNEAGKFRQVILDGPAGESLTTSVTDWDQDGWLDLVVGNDLRNGPDVFYRNDGAGALRAVPVADSLLLYSTETTMSVTTADLDNDLRFEMFIAEVGQGESSTIRERSRRTEEICATLDGEDAARCLRILERYQTAAMAARTGRFSPCLAYATLGERQGCLFEAGISQTGGTDEQARVTYCREVYGPTGGLFSDICRRAFEGDRPPYDRNGPYALSQGNKKNVLLVRGDDGRFRDEFDEEELEITEWSWNAKFADLNHDTWQDLYIVNGLTSNRFNGSNQFFRGTGGGHFERETEEVGLEGFLPTGAYAYVDYDRDGDLDIITVPFVAPMQVYENRMAPGRSILFELRDERGNAFGIGSTVTIRYGDGLHQIREVKTGGGFLSYDEPVAHFGLGDTQAVDEVEVVWSTGEKTVLPGPFRAGSRYVLTRSG